MGLQRLLPSRLSMGTIRQIPIAIPPAKEQQQIIALVDEKHSVIEQMELEIAANLKRSARLRQSILKRAFEGKLVPQDPNDEPASVLLARIKMEKPNGTAKSPQPRKQHLSKRSPRS